MSCNSQETKKENDDDDNDDTYDDVLSDDVFDTEEQDFFVFSDHVHQQQEFERFSTSLANLGLLD
jgi:hypothetical protein